MKRSAIFILSFLLACRADGQSPAKDDGNLQQLAQDFWDWRARYAPFTGDDVNRMERPGGVRDWSHAAIEKRRADLAGFESRWKQIRAGDWPIPQQVDYRLIASALARVRWELEINPRWKRDPNFYLEQTLTAVAEALTVPGPYDETRSREIVARIQNIPSILESGKANLTNPPGPFATVAVQSLAHIREQLRKMAQALEPATTLKKAELNDATESAADALEKFRESLQQRLPSLPAKTALGRDTYAFFLKNVALMPFTPEELLAMGRQEWDRAVAFEAFEKNRNKNVPPLQLARSIETWMADTATKEAEIRKFLALRDLAGDFPERFEKMGDARRRIFSTSDRAGGTLESEGSEAGGGGEEGGGGSGVCGEDSLEERGWGAAPHPRLGKAELAASGYDAV